MLRTVFDNRLIFPPVSRPKMILECGFGAGDWSVDVAEQYPDAEVRIQVFRPCYSNPVRHSAED